MTKHTGARASASHWPGIRAVAGLFALNGALYGMWASRIPAFKDAMALNHATLGALLLLLAAGAILAFPIAGRLTDKHGAAPMSRLLGLGNALCLMAIALSPNLACLAIALFLFGATHGAMDVAMNAWAAESDRASGKTIMPAFHAVWSFGAGVGAMSGVAAIAFSLSPLPHFLIAGTAVAALTLWIANIPWQSETRPHHEGPLFPLPKGPLLLVGLLCFCSTLGEGAMADWSAIYLRDVTLASESFAAAGFAVFSCTMVVVRLSGAFLTKLFGPVIATRLSGVAALIGVTLIVGFATPHMTMVGLAFLGLGYGLVVPLAFSRAANDPDLPQAAAIARVATLSYGGILLGPPIIGFVAALSSLRVSFALLGLLAIATIWMAGVLRAPR
ncbi:MFS transporter [Shimia abyssi]|uniref:Fucose permease n=1 Tax=Shimia abyssi TaxID=1662395 RepID=A0A2P8FEK4_9RHOB|nr:MFS transporter [Shimia abyssi]PSL20129.1 fucose permease [Shimia abyssi]